MEPEDISLEHMSHKEYMDWLCRPISGVAKLRLRWRKIRWKVALWRQLRRLQHEIEHEDPEGAQAELATLREHLVVEPVMKS